MADVKTLKQLNIGGENYLLKDAEARTRLTTAEADIDALETGKQNVIDASHKLAASLVSFTKDGDSKLTSTDVNAALLELENAIETGGTGSMVTVEKAETTTAGYAATYVVKQGGAQVGVAIDIPKDYLVKSAELKTAGASDPSGFPEGTKYIDFVVNAKDGAGTESHIYLNVADLVDAYTADESTIQMVNNQFSVKAVPMNLVTGLADALDAKAAEADLQGEIARATAAEALKFDKADAGALAKKDSATGTVPSQTITGVKATGDLTGSASITLTSTSTAASLTKGSFTPAGTITGEAIKGGSINVTLKDAASATAAVLDTAAYTPSGDVTVTLKDNTFNAITGVGSLPTKEADSWTANVPTVIDTTQFNGGSAATWTGASHKAAALTEQSKASFVNQAIYVAENGYDAESETLTFSAAPTAQAVTDRGTFTPDTVDFGTFNGGSAASLGTGFYTAGSAASFTEGAFSQGTLPTMAPQTVAVNTASFKGDEAADLKVNGVTYMKQVVDAKEFTPVATTLGFKGTTAEDVLITAVNYDKANASQTGSVAITDAELAVGTITVEAKNVTVS